MVVLHSSKAITEWQKKSLYFLVRNHFSTAIFIDFFQQQYIIVFSIVLPEAANNFFPCN